MPGNEISGATALVTGASRGFGRGIATALSRAGGYAGAKAAIRFIASCAAEESGREGLGIRFVSVLPELTPATGLGAPFAAAYAARAGADAATYTRDLGPVLTPEQAGVSITELAADPSYHENAYLLTAAGLSPVPGGGQR